MGDQRGINENKRIKELEEELSKIKYNKKTQHHYGLVKAKIAKLKESISKKKSGKKDGEGYSVRKTGDATIVMIGEPSVGKSTLLNALTNAESKTAEYAFTTLDVIPGLLDYKGAKIQILDVPGIISGAAFGKGFGKKTLSLLWNADMIMLVFDSKTIKNYGHIIQEIKNYGVRVNQKKPDVKITKLPKGGIEILNTIKLTKIEKQTIFEILKEFKLNNATIVIREDIGADQLVDSILQNRKYCKAISVLNKVDILSDSEIARIKKEFPVDIIVSGKNKINLDQFKMKIFSELGFIRIYLKESGKEADIKEPLIVKNGITLGGVCEKLHRDFVKNFKFARIWGKSVKFDGQRILNLKHEVNDEDIVEIHLR